MLLRSLVVAAVLNVLAPASRSVVLVPAAVREKSERFSSDLTARVRAGLARGAFELVEADGPACAEADCAAAAARHAGASLAVLVDVEVSDRDWVVALWVVDADGRVVSQSEARCDLCGMVEVLTVAENEAAALRGKLDSLTLGPAVLIVETRPVGADVQLDGDSVGAAPIERIVPTGRHRLRAIAPGYAPEERDIDAVAGVRERVVLDLVPLDSRRDRIARGFGWAAIAVGLAAIGTGAGLVAVHGRPNQLRCSGDDRDADGDCRLIYGTRPAGIALLVTGVALEVTGIVLASVFRRAAARRNVSRR